MNLRKFTRKDWIAFCDAENFDTKITVKGCSGKEPIISDDLLFEKSNGELYDATIIFSKDVVGVYLDEGTRYLLDNRVNDIPSLVTIFEKLRPCTEKFLSILGFKSGN